MVWIVTQWFDVQTAVIFLYDVNLLELFFEQFFEYTRQYAWPNIGACVCVCNIRPHFCVCLISVLLSWSDVGHPDISGQIDAEVSFVSRH